MNNRLQLVLVSIILSAVALQANPSLIPDSSSFQQPALLTSVGQAADVLILRGLCTRAGVEVRYSPLANDDSLSEVKSVILVAGGSSKGLGAAKMNSEVELARVKALVEAARKANLPVVVFHVGGEARRGALSDPFNEIAADVGDVVVVVKGGDEDGLFSKAAEKHKARYISIDKQIEVVGVLEDLFGKEKAEQLSSPPTK